MTMITAENDKKQLVAITKLKPWDRNPRGIDKNGFERLKRQLTKHGQFKPLIITPEGIVIGGNMRYRAYLELGTTELWVSIVEPKSEEEKVAIALADNDRAGNYDDQALAELVSELPELNLEDYHIDLGRTLSLQDLLNRFAPTEEDDFDTEAALKDIVEPTTKRGDIYTLGNHRLMCGDATEVADVEKLMGGVKADLLLTDPPYGIGEAAGKNKSRGELAVSKDYGNDKWDNEIPDETAFINMMQYSDNQIIFGGNYFVEYLRNSMCWLVWDKDNGESDFADVELAWTSFNKAARLYKWTWSGMIREGKREEHVHPTQKPTGLFVKILKDYSTSGQSILDLFGGSGSTLIACEQTDRICYMCELDCKYCDVIIKRWETLTGMKAELKQA